MHPPFDDPDLTGLHVLIVDDEHVVAKSLGRLLQVWGAQVVGPAGSVAKALALLQGGGQIDFAILDVNLRGEMAFELAHVLSVRGTPFILATGYGVSDIPPHLAWAPLLQKPFDPTRLAQAIKAAADAAASAKS
jgi:CheY-like chemotaxis protein